MITAKNLAKSYGGVPALKGVTFEVNARKITGFLGPNGAGKSTTLRILAGFLLPTSGLFTIGGVDALKAPLEARRLTGYMPEAVPLYGEMRVSEYLRFRAELKGVASKVRKARVAESMEKTRVTDVRDVLISKLSKGYRQRVGLADALVAKPKVLILDEPTAGLDPNQIREVRTVLGELKAETTILLSTHILAEVEEACDEVLLINRGDLVAAGTISEIRSRRSPTSLEVEIRNSENAIAVFEKDDSFARVHETKQGDATRFELHFKPGLSLDEKNECAERITEKLVNGGAQVRRVAFARSSLEEVFASLTMGTEKSS